MFITVESSLNNLQIVISSSSTVDSMKNMLRIFPSGNQTLLQEFIATLVEQTTKHIAAITHHITPCLEIILGPINDFIIGHIAGIAI